MKGAAPANSKSEAAPPAETKRIDSAVLVAVCMGQFREATKAIDEPSSLAIFLIPGGMWVQGESIPEAA